MSFDLSAYGLQGDPSPAARGAPWYVRGSQVYVRETSGVAAAAVGVAGMAGVQHFGRLENAIAAARALAKLNPAWPGNHQVVDQFWLQRLGPSGSYLADLRGWTFDGSEASLAAADAALDTITPGAAVAAVQEAVRARPKTVALAALAVLGALAMALRRGA